MPTAVIDIGTNTLLLLIVDSAMRPIVDLCRFGRLGKGLDATKRLADESIANSLEICREYRQVMDDHGVAAPRVVATQAAREATNAADFLGPAEQILRAKIEVITGHREAELAAIAVARTFPELAHALYLVVDVGGGSTELTTVDSGRIVAEVSMPIGAVRMAERHLRHDPAEPAEVTALYMDVDRHIGKISLPRRVPVIGVAGTATTMASIKLGLTRYDAAEVTGLRLSPQTITELCQRLFAASAAERAAIVGLEPARVDVIASGAAIFSRILTRIDAPAMITCDRGIRWGVAYEHMPPRTALSAS